MSVVDYTQSLLDPFDTTFTQPKLYDGSVTRSSGLKFRQTGNLTLDATGGENMLMILPGFGNGFCYVTAPSGHLTVAGPVFPTHLGTTTDRANVRKVRLVSSAMRFSLLNSSDDNEGYWEAIRVPVSATDLTLVDTTAPNGEDFRVSATRSWTNFSNYQTFQTGRLRDIHRYLFKLNSVAPDHPWRDIAQTETPTAFQCVDPAFDAIVIRFYGRIDAVTPSMLQYEFVSNQEVVYRDDTVMARLATMNTMVPNIDLLLDRTRFILPAIQVA